MLHIVKSCIGYEWYRGTRKVVQLEELIGFTWTPREGLLDSAAKL